MRFDRKTATPFVERGLRILDSLGLFRLLDRSDRSATTVLMYHASVQKGSSRIGNAAIDRDSLASHVSFLKRHCDLVSPAEMTFGNQERASGRPRVLLTFDDGLGNNAIHAMPVLEDLKAPAIFFVSTSHVTAGRYLWFIHARALFWCWRGARLELLGRVWNLGPSEDRERVFEEFVTWSRRYSVQKISSQLAAYPVESFASPELIDQEIRGLTVEEARAAARNPLFMLGAHTRNHPLLTACSDTELKDEIDGSGIDIEHLCGVRPIAFAYPEGDYDARVIEAVERAGFSVAFATSGPPKSESARFAVSRVGIYSGGTGILAARIRGWLRG